jgi:hypothetical protein
MGKTKRKRSEQTARSALRRRLRQFYSHFNAARWESCYALVDPRLSSAGRVEERAYVDSLRRFQEAYGSIDMRFVDINLHMDVSRTAQDSRPFAYAYVVWKDSRQEYHLFRERWVYERGKWYTRVAGLVVGSGNSAKAS